jgi:hypothetical protein
MGQWANDLVQLKEYVVLLLNVVAVDMAQCGQHHSSNNFIFFLHFSHQTLFLSISSSQVMLTSFYVLGFAFLYIPSHMQSI